MVLPLPNSTYSYVIKDRSLTYFNLFYLPRKCLLRDHLCPKDDRLSLCNATNANGVKTGHIMINFNLMPVFICWLFQIHKIHFNIAKIL